MRKLIELTFDYDETHPQFISLVSVENIHQAKHLTNLQSIKDMNASVIRTLSTILERGRKEGVFRGDLDPVDVHLLISAFCFFRVSNRHTFGAIFDRDLSDPKLRKRHKKMIIETIERMLEVQCRQVACSPGASRSTRDGACRIPRVQYVRTGTDTTSVVSRRNVPCVRPLRRFPSAAVSTPSCARSPMPVSTASRSSRTIC